MKNYRKLVLLVLIGILTLSLCACGSVGSSSRKKVEKIANEYATFEEYGDTIEIPEELSEEELEEVIKMQIANLEYKSKIDPTVLVVNLKIFDSNQEAYEEHYDNILIDYGPDTKPGQCNVYCAPREYSNDWNGYFIQYGKVCVSIGGTFMKNIDDKEKFADKLCELDLSYVDDYIK